MRLKDTDIVICPVCSGSGFIKKEDDDVSHCSELCPHGSYVTYETFKFIKLPHERAKLAPKEIAKHG